MTREGAHLDARQPIVPHTDYPLEMGNRSKSDPPEAGSRAKPVHGSTQSAAGLQSALVGSVTHYFPRRSAATVHLHRGTLSLGDRIHVCGHTSDFTQEIESLQLDGSSVPRAHAGQTVGLGLERPARKNDRVYLLS